MGIASEEHASTSTGINVDIPKDKDDRLYPEVGQLEDFGKTEDTDEKKPIKAGATLVAGSGVTTAEAEQMEDIFPQGTDILSTDFGVTSAEDIQNLQSEWQVNTTTKYNQDTADNSAKYFNNINSDNYFYKDVGAKTLEKATGLAEIYGKPFGGGPTGAFVTGMMGSIMGGGFPLGTAAAWVAYGFAQERDQNNFTRKLKNGMEDVLGDEKKYEYSGKASMTT